MKKTYLPLTDDLTMISVETDTGDKLEFLNGVVQTHTKNRFIPARSPKDGGYQLIIED